MNPQAPWGVEPHMKMQEVGWLRLPPNTFSKANLEAIREHGNRRQQREALYALLITASEPKEADEWRRGYPDFAPIRAYQALDAEFRRVVLERNHLKDIAGMAIFQKGRADHYEAVIESLERELADVNGKNGLWRRIFPRRSKNALGRGTNPSPLT
jgi:hypothetical protein